MRTVSYATALGSELSEEGWPPFSGFVPQIAGVFRIVDSIWCFRYH